MSDPIVLWILGILVSLLTLLVGAIYITVIKTQEKISLNQEKNHSESKDALEHAKSSSSETHKEIFSAINSLRDKFFEIDKAFFGFCQKQDEHVRQTKTEIKQLGDTQYKINHKITEIQAAISKQKQS